MILEFVSLDSIVIRLPAPSNTHHLTHFCRALVAVGTLVSAISSPLYSQVLAEGKNDSIVCTSMHPLLCGDDLLFTPFSLSPPASDQISLDSSQARHQEVIKEGTAFSVSADVRIWNVSWTKDFTIETNIKPSNLRSASLSLGYRQWTFGLSLAEPLQVTKVLTSDLDHAEAISLSVDRISRFYLDFGRPYPRIRTRLESGRFSGEASATIDLDDGKTSKEFLLLENNSTLLDIQFRFKKRSSFLGFGGLRYFSYTTPSSLLALPGDGSVLVRQIDLLDSRYESILITYDLVSMITGLADLPREEVPHKRFTIRPTGHAMSMLGISRVRVPTYDSTYVNSFGADVEAGVALDTRLGKRQIVSFELGGRWLYISSYASDAERALLTNDFLYGFYVSLRISR